MVQLQSVLTHINRHGHAQTQWQVHCVDLQTYSQCNMIGPHGLTDSGNSQVSHTHAVAHHCRSVAPPALQRAAPNDATQVGWKARPPAWLLGWRHSRMAWYGHAAPAPLTACSLHTRAPRCMASI